MIWLRCCRVPDALVSFGRVTALAVAALLPIINPAGVAPLFLSLTPWASEPTRAAMSRRIAVNSFVVLLTSMLAGSYVLVFFGLSLPVIKIAGGLLVTVTGWRLVHADASPDSSIIEPSSQRLAEQIASHSFYPLTFPLTIGPGSITVAVTLGAGLRRDDVTELAPVLGATVGIMVVSGIVYLCFRFASRVLGAIGTTGTVVLLRLSAFVLLSIGVQIFCDGIGERFGMPPRR